jgi:MerR family transcriptional regulator, global nitrogen regulator
VAKEISYKERKVISIGVVSELTGLSERQIRYYEQKKLLSPERSNKGYRKYSFVDVETLIEIANQREEGVPTGEIKEELEKKYKKGSKLHKKMISGQINAQFGTHKK